LNGHALERRDPGAIRSAALSVAVHLLLVLVLFFGIRWKTSSPEPVMAELWSQLPAIEAPRPPPPPPPVVVAPKPEPAPAPKAEPEPKPEPKPDIALEQERKLKEEAERKRREEEARRKREEELKAKAEAERREKELKAKAEAERKEKELAEARRREEQAAERRRIDEQLAKALTPAPKSSAPTPGAPVASADPTAMAGWRDQISAKVRSNIILPPDLAGNPEAVFDVFLLPTGEVLSVKLVRSSGNKVLDDAWERAILKSSPLPRPAQPELFRRDLRLVFKPRAD
jgi:colicin import membrane protein